MPGPCGLSFSDWVVGHEDKRPGKARVNVLESWINNLVRVENVRSGYKDPISPRCGEPPYHHFSKSDCVLLDQIAKNVSCTDQERLIIKKMLQEHDIAVKEIELLKQLQREISETQIYLCQEIE